MTFGKKICEIFGENISKHENKLSGKNRALKYNAFSILSKKNAAVLWGLTLATQGAFEAPYFVYFMFIKL